MCKIMDGSPLTSKVAYGHQKAIQGLGCVPKCGLPWGDTDCSVKVVLEMVIYPTLSAVTSVGR